MNMCILTTGAPRPIGFIATRFHGTDGVTLEAKKWARILSELGHGSTTMQRCARRLRAAEMSLVCQPVRWY